MPICAIQNPLGWKIPRPAPKKVGNLLVGAAAMGSDAGPWIDVLSLVIFNKMTREQFAYYIYAFPTTTCGPLMMLGMFW